MLRDRLACGCVENAQRSGQRKADSDPLAIRTQRGPSHRAIVTSILGQRSHFLRRFVQADVKIPFRVLRRVMASAAEAGYGNVNFAAMEESTTAMAAKKAQ